MIWQEAFSGLRENKSLIIDLIMIVAIFAFLLCYFEPHLLFSKTITTGGDTGSHYYTAQYLIDYLLPQGKISGWCQGNLAGYPMLQYYFPLPFLLMALLTLALPLQIAFKLIVVLGTFLLPLCTYLFFRLLKQPFPTPIMGALFSLSFLFMEGHSMWGGNIPSTLAGQFCFSLGLALSILFLGLLYHTISEQKGYFTCSILFALIGLCHGYALLFVGFASSFFLFTKDKFGRNLKGLIKIQLIGFSLMAFWLLPLIAFLPDTTRYSLVWVFLDWKQVCAEVFPAILYPFIGMFLIAGMGLVVKKIRRPHSVPIKPWVYVWFMAFCGLGLYGIGYRMKVVDIRFLPFFQFFLVIGGAAVFTLVAGSLKIRAILGFTAMLITLLWVDSHETFISKWIRSNFVGFENKLLWDAFSSTNLFLKGSTQDPRVAYEYSLINQQAGTVRAFEDLPLFSGRSTLEGLQLPASLCVPAIFYLQSEISQRASMPIPEYNYSRFNLKRGIEHLKLFNVEELILVEEETKERVKESFEFILRHSSGPYDVYKVRSNPNRYVEPLSFKPVLTTEKEWRYLFYHWFRLGDLSVPLVFKDRINKEDHSRFRITDKLDVTKMPKEPVVSSPAATLKEIVKEEEVLIDGAYIDKPLLIKISYHPNWKVEGADGIYLASPGFMLIYPNSSHVRLYYGRTWPDYIGASMSALALLLMLFWRSSAVTKMRNLLSRWFDRFGTKAAFIGISALIIASIYYLLTLSPEYPALPYHKGLAYYEKKDYGTAKTYFHYILERHPQSFIVDHAGFLYAMCFYNQNDWDNALINLKWLLKTYPETVKASESSYIIGLCYQYLNEKQEAMEQYKKTIREFPKEIWAKFARDRLKELKPL